MSESIAAADLVVLSHLRWTFVWQRPQHLVSRLATGRAAEGGRTWFVEEPVVADVPEPVLRKEQYGEVTRVWLEVPDRPDYGDYLVFNSPGTDDYAALLDQALGDSPRHVWLYSPMALDIAEALAPSFLIYDVMDDLASFAQAPEGLVLRQRRALAEADVVFTGGRSLHAGILAHRTRDVYLYPSGVETAHYASSRELREPHDVPVAGYVGVVDERLDLQLIADLAADLPEWRIQVVGPVVKIKPVDLPQAPNLEYLGLQPYEQLPAAMAGFDVALMPFALNAATRSISPTKTLEYLAAGLPVVSTRVPDVVADFGTVVRFADDGAAFADACRAVVDDRRDDRDRKLRPIQVRHEWDFIVAEMQGHIDAVTARQETELTGSDAVGASSGSSR